MGAQPGLALGKGAYAPGNPAKVIHAMHVFFGMLAVVFIILGFIGILGGMSLILWPLGAVSLWLAIKTYPRDRPGPRSGPTVHQP